MIVNKWLDTTITFDRFDRIEQIYGFISALKTINYNDYDVRLKITNINNYISFRYTIDYLIVSLIERQDDGDSDNILLNIILDCVAIYNNENDIINELFLITAIRSSGLLNDDKTKLLKSRQEMWWKVI